MDPLIKSQLLYQLSYTPMPLRPMRDCDYFLLLQADIRPEKGLEHRIFELGRQVSEARTVDLLRVRHDGPLGLAGVEPRQSRSSIRSNRNYTN